MLNDDLKALLKRSEVAGCTVALWAAKQDAEFQEVLEALRSAPNLNLTEALTLLRQYHGDLPFKRTSFTLHMRGTCACPTA